MSNNPLQEIWSAICDECKKSISEVAFNCFLKDLKPVFFNENEFTVSLNDEYKKGIVEQTYTELFKKINDDNRLLKNLLRTVSDKINKLNVSDRDIVISEIETLKRNIEKYTTEKSKYQIEFGKLEGRIKEIARIMSGTDITENLYNSAKELIDRSLKNENL